MSITNKDQIEINKNTEKYGRVYAKRIIRALHGNGKSDLTFAVANKAVLESMGIKEKVEKVVKKVAKKK